MKNTKLEVLSYATSLTQFLCNPVALKLQPLST